MSAGRIGQVGTHQLCLRDTQPGEDAQRLPPMLGLTGDMGQPVESNRFLDSEPVRPGQGQRLFERPRIGLADAQQRLTETQLSRAFDQGSVTFPGQPEGFAMQIESRVTSTEACTHQAEVAQHQRGESG
jgi:hypothetical protein